MTEDMIRVSVVKPNRLLSLMKIIHARCGSYIEQI
jgi:hypothetical protein